MLIRTLQIRFASSPRGIGFQPVMSRGQSPNSHCVAAAWFIPGADPAAWLSELSRWQVPLADLTLRIVPVSRGDRRPSGVLVTAAHGAQPRTSARCQPYSRIASRLYLPIDACLDPEV